MVSVLCFVFVSASNIFSRGRGLNVLIVEFGFNRCEKRISTFDGSFGNAVDGRKHGEISDKQMCKC